MEGQSGHSGDERRHFCWSEGQGRSEAAGAPVACSQGKGGGDAGARAVRAGPARMGLIPPGAPRTCPSGTLLPSGGRQRGVPCAGFTGGCRSEAEVGLRWSWFEVTVESRDPWASPGLLQEVGGPGRTHARGGLAEPRMQAAGQTAMWTSRHPQAHGGSRHGRRSRGQLLHLPPAPGGTAPGTRGPQAPGVSRRGLRGVLRVTQAFPKTDSAAGRHTSAIWWPSCDNGFGRLLAAQGPAGTLYPKGAGRW